MSNPIKLVVGPEDSILKTVEVMRDDEGIAIVFNRKCEGLKEYCLTIPGGRVLIKKEKQGPEKGKSTSKLEGPDGE